MSDEQAERRAKLRERQRASTEAAVKALANAPRCTVHGCALRRGACWLCDAE